MDPLLFPASHSSVKSATAGGHEDNRGQEEDTGLASAAKGQQQDKRRTVTRLEEDKMTQTLDTEFRGAASQCGQPSFSYERTPTVNCLRTSRFWEASRAEKP